MNKFEFKKYPDIENSYREKFMDVFAREVPDNRDRAFYITEKIHGANSQIAFYRNDEKKGWDVKYGKRTSFIDEDAKFYNLPVVLRRLMPNFRKFIDKMCTTWSGEDVSWQYKAVIFYGEIFGGAYPHKEVDKDSPLLPHNGVNGNTVQHGVWYCPENDWACFDVRVQRFDGTWEFVDQLFFFMHCEDAGVPTVPLLAITSNLKEALAYPNDGESVVYKRYGLPKIEGNIMEGVVIKPVKDMTLSTGERAVIKNKNDHFKEIRHHNIARTIEPDSPEALLIEQAKDYITEARLDNVISHFGEVERKDVGTIIGLLGKDACDEFMKDHNGDMNLLTDEQKKQVKKVFGGKAAELVREKLVPKL